MSKKSGRHSAGRSQQENDVNKLFEIIQTAAVEKREVTILEMISHPISCGYVLDFCQKGYCAENLNFYMAVDKFKDDCAALDLKDPVGIKAIKEMANKMWAEYLSLNSPNEVSLPSEDREETQNRMKEPEVYGVTLWDVALKDPFKTLHKDILPRFVKSPQYAEMVDKVKAIAHAVTIRKSQTPSAASSYKYEIEFPKKTNLTDERINSLGSKEITLDEILNDRILFTEMLTYLEKKFKAENLKCARQIRRFEEVTLEKKPGELKEFVWDIYLNFIEPGSPYEISCTNMQRKYVQLRLGCPVKGMFEGIKESTMLVLKADHKAFSSTLTQKLLKDRLNELQVPAGGDPARIASNSEKKSFFSRIKIF